MKNFVLRSLTGIVYVALIISGILLGQPAFFCLFMVVTFFCLWEFYNLLNTKKNARINCWYNCAGGLLMFTSTYLYASGTYNHSILFAYLAYVVFVLISELYKKQPDPIIHAAFLFLGQIYVALPLSLLNFLVFHGNGFGTSIYYPMLILSLFVFIWVNDTGAYLVGILLGKHRLFPRISPKKSWEGFFGGLIFVLATSFVFAYFEPKVPYYHWIGISILVVIASTLGDLVESLIKRTLDVKDSGRALPGHGGFLDRFDSLLLATYAMLFYVELFIK